MEENHCVLGTEGDRDVKMRRVSSGERFLAQPKWEMSVRDASQARCGIILTTLRCFLCSITSKTF